MDDLEYTLVMDEDLMNELFSKDAFERGVILDYQELKVNDMNLEKNADGYHLRVVFDLHEESIN